MAYVPTVWVNGVAPAIDDTNLNHMETQYTQALADIPEDQAAGTPSERTLGGGAVQAAAGDHSHVLAEDQAAITDTEAHDAVDTGGYTAFGAGETDLESASITATLSISIIVSTVGTGGGSNGAGRNNFRWRHYIDGTLDATSAAIVDGLSNQWTNVGSKVLASSGVKVCKIVVDRTADIAPNEMWHAFELASALNVDIV